MKKISTNTSRKITKSNKYKSWVICMLLILAAGSQSAQAQGFITWNTPSGTPLQITGSYTGGTVTATQGATGNSIATIATGSLGAYLNLNGAAGSQAFYTQGPNSTYPSRTLTFTFSTPVIIDELSIADITRAASYNDGITFSGVTFTSVTGSGCTFTTASATPVGAAGATNTQYARWTTSTTAISSFTIDFVGNGTLTHAYMNYAMKVTAAACNAGTTAPTLSANTISNVCPATTVDLTSITASNLPGGTTLTWHTGTPATTVNKITTPSAVGAGTYYAAFFDATNNCYSGTSGNGSATTVVTATVNTCCTAGTSVPSLSATTISNVCPTTTVNLTSITASNLPVGNTLTWHTGTPATTVNKITTPAAVGAGTYYAAFFDATNNCYSGIGGNGSATTVVTATVNPCIAIGAGTIQCGQTQIIPAPVAGTPGQLTLVVSVNVSSAGCFPLTVSGTGFSLANGITNACTNTTGIQNFNIPLSYDGSALGTLNFTVGAAGSCSANLTLPSTSAIIPVWTLDCVPSVGPTLH